MPSIKPDTRRSQICTQGARNNSNRSSKGNLLHPTRLARVGGWGAAYAPSTMGTFQHQNQKIIEGNIMENTELAGGKKASRIKRFFSWIGRQQTSPVVVELSAVPV